MNLVRAKIWNESQLLDDEEGYSHSFEKLRKTAGDRERRERERKREIKRE